MRILIILGVGLSLVVLMSSCATPSEIHRQYKDGKLINETIKYDNSTFCFGKAYGIKIGYNMEDYSPVFKILYGEYLSGRVRTGTTFSSRSVKKGLSIFKGADLIDNNIVVSPAIIH